MKRFLLLAALPLALCAQVQNIPNTTFPVVRGLINSNFSYLSANTEPAVAAGTTAQYYRGDKSWQSLATGTYALFSATSPLVFNSSTGVFSCPSCGSGAVASVFGRTGAVVAAANDYSFSQLSGSLAIGQIGATGTASSTTYLRGDYTWATVTGGVSTVFGRSGAVVAAANDYSYSQLSGTPYSLFSAVSPITYNSSTGAFSCSTCLTSNAVSSVFGRTGAVVAAANDYSFSQLSGSATNAQLPVVSVANGGLNTSAPAFAALTDGATVTWAIGSALVANADLTFTTHGGARTLNITGAVSGGEYVLRVIQDATGGEGLTLGTGCTWKVSNGGAGAVTPSTSASAVDVLVFKYNGLTSSCYANFNKLFN